MIAATATAPPSAGDLATSMVRDVGWPVVQSVLAVLTASPLLAVLCGLWALSTVWDLVLPQSTSPEGGRVVRFGSEWRAEQQQQQRSARRRSSSRSSSRSRRGSYQQNSYERANNQDW